MDKLSEDERNLLRLTVAKAADDASFLLNAARRHGFNMHMPENKAKLRELEADYDNLKTLLSKLP